MNIEPIRLILFTRYPVAGKAKTRLIPAVGEGGAAKIHKLLAQKTVATIASVAKNNANVDFIISYTGAEKGDFQNWLGNENIIFQKQIEGDLSDRLLAMVKPAPVIFFGSDTPDLNQTHVNDAVNALRTYDVVVGPALDGGYYLIGMNLVYDELLRDMPWSSDQVLPETLRRCDAMGLKVHMLGPLSDCDEAEDLKRWDWLLSEYRDVQL